MNLLMPLQVALLREPPRTDIADVFFPGVNQPVNLVRVIVSIALAANVTREGFDSKVEDIMSL